jgi:hypothetical protein
MDTQSFLSRHTVVALLLADTQSLLGADTQSMLGADTQSMLDTQSMGALRFNDTQSDTQSLFFLFTLIYLVVLSW